MNITETYTDNIQTFIQEQDPSLAETSLRQCALENFKNTGLPSRRNEAWRYTNLNELTKKPFYLSEPSQAETNDNNSAIEQFLSHESENRIVMLNGEYVESLSHYNGASMTVSPINTQLDISLKPQYLDDSFVQLNTAGFSHGYDIVIKKTERPVELALCHVMTNNFEDTAYHGKYRITIEDGAALNLTETYQHTADTRYWQNQVLQVLVGSKAKCHHELLQIQSHAATHFETIDVDTQQAGEYRFVGLSLGASLCRIQLNINFLDQFGNVGLYGLSMANEGQVNDFHVRMNHLIPDCTSDIHFKSIVGKGGKSVVDGLIYVEKDAQQSLAAYAHDGLMLSRKSEIDSKPQLEILADDVKCSHGTSIGEIDEEQIFYLQTRGLDKEQAYKTLCYGFARDIIDRVNSEYIDRLATKSLDQQFLRSEAS